MSARCRAFLSLDRVNVPRIARIQSPLHDRFRSGLAWHGDFSSVHEAADGGLVCIVSRHSFGWASTCTRRQESGRPASLAAASRGELTGIAVSHCAIGDGVNAANIRRCVEMLAAAGYEGVLSLECEGQGGPMIERSLAWTREVIKETTGARAAQTK